jgi:hypothetical protein
MVRLKLSKIRRVKLKDLIPRREVKWTSRQLGLKEEIIRSYNARKGIITISKDNEILDGNHRYYILIEHYGGEHEVIVKKKRFGRKIYVIRAWFRFLILSPVLIPIIIYKTIWEN